MKRQNLTAIISRVLTLQNRNTCYYISNKYTIHQSSKFDDRILRAAVNEINRLEAEDNRRKFNEGYEQGFETCRITSTVSITAAGVVTELQNAICGNLKPIQP